MAYEPIIIGFLCNWCSYRAADLSGAARLKQVSSLRTVRVMCSSRVEPRFVLKAFKEGADGVLIGGCHPGECHYIEGSIKTLQRFQLLQTLLSQLGIEKERFHLVWASSAEAQALSDKINEMTRKLREIGPLPRDRGFLTRSQRELL